MPNASVCMCYKWTNEEVKPTGPRFVTFVSMSVRRSSAPCTSSSMFWPHTRPMWFSSFRRSTQSLMFFSSFPSRLQVNKCCNHNHIKTNLSEEQNKELSVSQQKHHEVVRPPLCTETSPASCSWRLRTATSALQNHKAKLGVGSFLWINQ